MNLIKRFLAKKRMKQIKQEIHEIKRENDSIENQFGELLESHVRVDGLIVKLIEGQRSVARDHLTYYEKKWGKRNGIK